MPASPLVCFLLSQPFTQIRHYIPQLHCANKTIVVPIEHLGLLDLLFAIWAMHLAHCAFTLRSWVRDSLL